MRSKTCIVAIRRSVPILILMSLAVCSSGPPDFFVERERARPVDQNGLRSFSVGSVATPPPGDYRFVRMHADGAVEVRELLTFNGPGPWLAYVGRALVPAAAAREALSTIDATSPASAPGDRRAPCVLAFDPVTGGEWQGCAYPGLAERVLSQVPRLTAPEVSPECHRRVCQVRLLREVPAPRHERTSGILQDIVLDESGAFWCASEEIEQQHPVNTLRVERAGISRRDARRVFEWLTAGIELTVADDPSSSIPQAVMVRGRGSDWTRLRRSEADTIRARWQRLADRLPAECRPGL